MKIPFTIVLFLTVLLLPLSAQEGINSVYKFLEIPYSSHAAALGGNNVSIIDDDLSLVYHNPSLLGKEMDQMLSLDYTSYISDINIGTASFCKATKNIGTFAFGIHYMDYGSFKETTAENLILGDFSVKDMILCGFYSYDFTEYWRGGVGAKLIYSDYADYTSFGVAVDLGLSYYNPDNEFSFGVVLKNMGSQIKAYNDVYEKMPWDVQFGITKQLSHAPLKFSVTLQNMREWDFNTRKSDGSNESSNFFQKCMKHVLFGVDFTPGQNFYASIGYSYRRTKELSVGDKSGLTGFSAGLGFRIKSYRVGFSAAQYHVSGYSYQFNVSKRLSF